MALPRRGGHAAIGPRQRKLSLKRLFGHQHDAQRGALPRRPRRGQDRDLAGRVTGGRRALRPRVPRRESQKECAGNQRKRCRCSPDELACRKHWQSLAPVALGDSMGCNHSKSRSAIRISAAGDAQRGACGRSQTPPGAASMCARRGMLVLHDDAEREYACGRVERLPETKVGTFTQAQATHTFGK